MKTLADDCLISNCALEVGMKLLLQKFVNVNFVSLSTHDSKKLFMEGISSVVQGDLYKSVERILTYDIIVAPLLKNSHYTLVIINLKRKIFYYSDSMNTRNEHNLRCLFNSFKQCMKYYADNGIDIAKPYTSNEWSMQILPTALQADPTNCGVFVMQNAQIFLQNDCEPAPIKTFSPNQKRAEIREIILKNLMIDTDKCPICDNGDEVSAAMHLCELCGRWVHYVCDEREFIGNVLRDSFDYICKRCSAFFCRSCFWQSNQ